MREHVLLVAQLKQQALDLTPVTDIYSVGVSQALSVHWQLGLDLQSARTSSTVGTVNQPSQPDTGDIYTYTGNVTGTDLFTERDVSVFTISRIDARPTPAIPSPSPTACSEARAGVSTPPLTGTPSMTRLPTRQCDAPPRC